MNVKHGRCRAALTRRVRADTPCRSTRRAFLLAAAAWSALAWIDAALAQPRPKPVIIGWLNFGSRESNMHLLSAFKQGLAALGWKEGQQFVIEDRYAEGRGERLQPLAEELAAKKPVLIVAAPNSSVAAAARSAPATPIVQANGGDPVLAGLAASLARPGGMVTGLSSIVSDVAEKYLEFLLALAPKPRRVGILTSITLGAGQKAQREAAQRSAARHSVEARFEAADKPEEIEPAISRLAKQGAQALIVLATPLSSAERPRIVKLALAHRWPVIGSSREWAESGAVLSYGADLSANYRRAAYYVDRILKGAKPGDLPIEQPTKIELVINAKQAKALGLTISKELAVRADRVIE